MQHTRGGEHAEQRAGQGVDREKKERHEAPGKGSLVAGLLLNRKGVGGSGRRQPENLIDITIIVNVVMYIQ
jgi:hypothetical protein